ncbi:hypothetical protein BGX23_007080 [Mortierella sp. AD031]|nr:hypothetical protein BGX23_007080 [Mortierella sp. AD031]
MVLRGLFIVPEAPTSSEFLQFQQKMPTCTLVKLYRLFYAIDSTYDMNSKDWSTEFFFHGTGHCGCLMTRVLQESLPGGYLEQTEHWCGNLHCSTQGILNYGHLNAKIKRGGGHFFSSRIDIAKSYAMQQTQFMNKDEHRELMALFLCRVRNIQQQTSQTKFRYVTREEDIVPCYLAIARNH